MDNSELIQRVSKLEEQNISQDREIKELKEDTKNIPRLETLMEMVIETTKENSATMKEVNKNLTGLNSKVDNVDGRVGELEDAKKENKKITVDFILKIAGGLILAYLVIALNLK